MADSVKDQTIEISEDTAWDFFVAEEKLIALAREIMREDYDVSSVSISVTRCDGDKASFSFTRKVEEGDEA